MGLGFLLLLFILLLRNFFEERQANGGKERSLGLDVAISDIGSRGADASAQRSSSVHLKGIELLKQRGFSISAEKIGRSSASGQVQVRVPQGEVFKGERVRDGDIIECDAIIVASDGKGFFLEGDIVVKKEHGGLMGETDLSPSPLLDQAFPTARVNLEDSVIVLDGSWKTTTRTLSTRDELPTSRDSAVTDPSLDSSE